MLRWVMSFRFREILTEGGSEFTLCHVKTQLAPRCRVTITTSNVSYWNLVNPQQDVQMPPFSSFTFLFYAPFHDTGFPLGH